MVLDVDRERRGPGQRHEARRRVAAAVLVVLTGLIALVGFLPRLPAAWQSATHFSTIGDGSYRAGKLTVTGCDRGALLLDWTCTGNWAVNDVAAQPLPPVRDVTLVNDYRYHRAGTRLDVVDQAGSHRGFLWGRSQQILVIAWWIGLACCLTALMLAGLAWRGRSVLRSATAALVASVVLLVVASTLVVG